MIPRIILLSLSVLLEVAVCYNHHDIQGVTVIKESFPTKQYNVEFGTGYNSINLQRTYNSAVDVTREHRVKDGFIECTFKIKLCKTREEFFDAMSGGLSASGSYMGVEGSASVKFLTETQITSLDSVLVASVDAITDTEIVTNAKYSATGQAILDEKDYARFVETYGTHYLRKIILGGKMMLVMKFSSNTQEEKRSLDTKLGVSTGTFGVEAEFSAAMKHIRESSTLEVSLYASGSNIEPPTPDVESCIQYSIDFAKSVLTYSAVREVEYAALWTIPGTTDEFKHFIFPLQGKTDKIVRLSVELLNVQSRVIDMIALKKADLSYFTGAAWKNITSLGEEATDLRTRLQNRFKTSYVNEFGDIILEFRGRAGLINDQIDEIFAEQRKYDATKSMFLKSAGTGRYISTNSGVYPRLDSRSPVPMAMEDTNGGTKITIGGNHYNYIVSSHTPNYVLCMGKNNWYVFWVARKDMYGPKCQWRLAHSTSTSKQHLDYGDRVIIYNRYWPSYIMGVSDDRKWIETVDDTFYQDKVHQWVVEKSN